MLQRSSPRRVSRVSFKFTFLALAILVFISQIVSLVGRVSDGSTDFSVFYNTSQILKDGAGGEIYRVHDEETGWLRAIPPFGQAIFQPLAAFDVAGAAAIWGVFNLVLLVVSVFALRGIAQRLERQKRLYSGAVSWLAVLLLLLAAGSVQVGQWSAVFVACWIFSLNLASKRRDLGAGFLLAIPAAIKLYPLLLLAIPVFTGKRRQGLGMAFGIAFCILAPTLFYGARTLPLTTAFVDEVVFNPQGRIAESQAAWPVGNQGIDAVLLRFLADNPKLTRAKHYPNYPHLSLERAFVVRIANVLRALFLALTIAVAWRWRRAMKWRPKTEFLYWNLQMAALWCSTLFLLMPGAKARYSVYAVLGFWPLLVAISAARRANEYSISCALTFFTILCAVFVASAIPESWRAYNIGFAGALMLWSANLFLLHADKKRTTRRQKIADAHFKKAEIAI